MPELPEVDMARHALQELAVGKRILSVEALCGDSVAFPDVNGFCSALTGQTIIGTGRRGKFLFMELQNGYRLIVHFRMTGFLMFTESTSAFKPHTHIVFHLNGAKDVRFIDPRRFGRMWLVKRGEADPSGVALLGPEPNDSIITGEYLHKAFRGHTSAVKTMLMDQHLLAGIGNIYSDEILFQARIHPASPAFSLSGGECAEIARLIPLIMNFFTRKNRLPSAEYMAAEGKAYGNTPYLQVYGRKGKGCPRCGTALESIAICGRTSVYCPMCTPLISGGTRRSPCPER